MLLSQAAYLNRPSDPDATEYNYERECIAPCDELKLLKWHPWRDFPSANEKDPLTAELKRVHLRVELWVNEPEKSVAVAFGGTEFRNLNDWKSNLRWFIPIRNDEYSVIVGKFVPAFVSAYKQRLGKSGFEYLKGATLYATGHSLGAGLAEEFAYSLSVDPDVPRVTKVYAFDPTPVTGFTSVPEETRKANKQNLKIDRIYERGEILAALRSITSFFHLPPACDPEVRQIRYNLFWAPNPIKGHSIVEFGNELATACNQRPEFPDPEVGQCCSP